MLRKIARGAGLAAAFAALMASAPAMPQEPIRLYAAGSLKAAMTDIAAAFQRESGIAVAPTFGASGLLRDRIVQGEKAEVFASANMAHPQSLAQAGRAGAVRAFALNQLCALAGPKVPVTTATLLDRMLDDRIKLGTSTPKADPSGDYAWDLFAKAEKVRAGAFAGLVRKARTLTGGPDSPPPPKDRNVYGAIVEKSDADIFLNYCTNAVLAKKEVPALQIVAIPETMAVGAEYGLTVVKGARPEAERFAAFVLSPAGRDILARHGFGLPAR